MSLTKKIQGVFATKILILIFNFTNSVLIARILGVEGRGEYALFFASATILSLVFSFGLTSASGFFIPKADAYIKKIFLKGTGLYLLTVFLVVLPMFLIKPLAKHWLLPGNLYEYRNIALMIILVISMLLINLMLLIYESKLNFKSSNALKLFSVIFLSVVYIIFFFLFPNISINQFLIVFTASQLIILLVISCFFYFSFKTELSLSQENKNLKSFYSIMAWGGIAWLANIFQMLNYRIDFWFIQYFDTIHSLGIYSLAASLAQLLWFLPQSIAAVLFPYASKGEFTHEKIIKWMVALRCALYIAIFIGIVAAISFPFIIPLLFGKPFASSAYVFNLLIIGTIPFCITNVISSIFSGTNRVSLCMWGALIGLLFTILLDIILIPKYGINGAIIATIASYWATTIFSIILFRKKYKIPVSEILILKKSDVQMLFKKLYSIKNNI